MGNIVSISPTTDLYARNDSYDFEEEVDLFADLFADRPDSPIDKNVYTASESLETPQEPLGRGHWIRQLSIAARKNLKQSNSIYRSALYYKARQPRPVEPGPVRLAANEPDLPELPLITRAVFMAGRIAKIHQKDLPLELRGWKDNMKHLYKAE